MAATERYPLPGLDQLKSANTGFFLRDNGSSWRPEDGCGLFLERPFDENSSESAGFKYGYDILLPKLNGKDVVQVIQDRFQRLGLDERLSVLDVGCWTGKALEDCARMWKGKINGVGITASLPRWYCPDNRDVEIICADAHNLASVLDERKFSVIVSNMAIGYMFDSKSVLEQIWQVLNNKGVALINGLYWSKSRRRDLDLLNKWLKKSKFEINFQSSRSISPNPETAEFFDLIDVTMVKNRHDNVELPVKPLGVKKHYHDYPEILFYGFQF